MTCQRKPLAICDVGSAEDAELQSYPWYTPVLAMQLPCVVQNHIS